MKKKHEFFNNKPPLNNNQLPNTSSDEKENISFKVAVMGYTLKNEPHEKCIEIESVFLKQIKREPNNSCDLNISKTYKNIASEVNITILLMSDDDPQMIYQCGRANGKSLTSDACIIFYDPTQESCLYNLDKYLTRLFDTRMRSGSETVILVFIGINQDKPEKHLFKKSEILNCIVKYYNKDFISIYQTNLDPLRNCSEHVEIIIKNLAICCLKEYQKTGDEEITITSAQTKLPPLSSSRLETSCSVYTTLIKANNEPKGIHECFVPKEIIVNITVLLIDLFFKEYENPKLLFDIYTEIFIENTAYLLEKLVTADTPDAPLANVLVTADASDSSLTNVVEKRKEPKRKCSIM